MKRTVDRLFRNSYGSTTSMMKGLRMMNYPLRHIKVLQSLLTSFSLHSISNRRVRDYYQTIIMSSFLHKNFPTAVQQWFPGIYPLLPIIESLHVRLIFFRNLCLLAKWRRNQSLARSRSILLRNSSYAGGKLAIKAKKLMLHEILVHFALVWS